MMMPQSDALASRAGRPLPERALGMGVKSFIGASFAIDNRYRRASSAANQQS